MAVAGVKNQFRLFTMHFTGHRRDALVALRRRFAVQVYAEDYLAALRALYLTHECISNVTCKEG